MKLYIQYEKGNQSGKGKFIERLVPELEKLGCSCQWERSGADATLGLTRWREETVGKKILRIDGIYLFSDKHNDWNNKRIRKSIKSADVVIYQSAFAKRSVESVLKVRASKDYVIFNGANPGDYTEQIASPYPVNVVCSAKWYARDNREHKRLVDLYTIAIEYTKKHSDTCFWFAGETGKFKPFNTDQIKFLGALPEVELRKYLKMAQIYLHIPWYSWCDNSLIEAICAGCIPIGSNIGGNAEVIKACGGIIVTTDKDFGKRITTEKPPKINAGLVIDAIEGASDLAANINVEPVSIKTIAKKYCEVVCG